MRCNTPQPDRNSRNAREAYGVISQGIDAVILTILTREISLLARSTREA